MSSREPEGRASSASYTYSPAGPFNQANGNGPILAVDQRPNEASSLTWTSEPLSVPTEATGWWSLDFWASVNAPDTDFVVEITDVAPDGTSRQMGRGWLNAPRAFSRSNPRPLVPDAIYKFSVEVWPTSYVFPAGHRIRVDLSGSDCCVLGSDPNPTPARVTVYQDEHHPSRVVVPVIGAVAAEKLRGKRGGNGRWDD